MVTPIHVEPKFGGSSFNCLHCRAFAQQYWWQVRGGVPGDGYMDLEEIGISSCAHCDNRTYWFNRVVFFPDLSITALPNDDLNENIRVDYAEAGSIVAKSPRGAAALLRLCIQKLCKQLGESGKNIDQDIASLVKKGLDIRVQRALDIVRVIGNEAVHPGELDLRDDRETVGMLFTLVNAIANDMITQPRLRDEMYEKLPKSKLDGIEARNSKARPSN